MPCPKCRHENSEAAQYCGRCHAPLRYTCPACKHVQPQGGICEKCGVDFSKYAAMLVFQAQDDSRKAVERSRRSYQAVKQVLLLPVTGGISLIRYVLGILKGE